jgi:hypothetical protein
MSAIIKELSLPSKLIVAGGFYGHGFHSHGPTVTDSMAADSTVTDSIAADSTVTDSMVADSMAALDVADSTVVEAFMEAASEVMDFTVAGEAAAND